MAEPVSFDEIDSTEGPGSVDSRKAFWELDFSDEKGLLEWLLEEKKYCLDKNRERFLCIRRNLQIYRGIQYRDQTLSTHEHGKQPARVTGNRTPKVVSNILFDITDTKISRAVKYKPAVAILPTNDEFDDKIAAETVKSIVDHVWYQNKYHDQVKPRTEKTKHTMGEGYVFVLWDESKGDIHQSWKQAEQAAKAKGEAPRVPLVDDYGKQKVDDKGSPRFIDRPVRTGDVVYEPEIATNVLVERCGSFEDAHYLFRRKLRRPGELRAKYPEKKDKFSAGDAVRYNYKYNTEEVDERFIEEWHFYFRRTEFLEKGRYIVFTKDCILENKDFPYDHRELPCERITDIDYPDDQDGEAFLEQVKGIAMLYNNLNNMVARNLLLVSHPKWMMPKGAAKKTDLGNSVTIVEYKGATAPALVQSRPVPAELFKHIETLKEMAIQGSGHSPISRGEPPPGVEAGIALQFLDEKENERQNLAILKTNEFDRNMVMKTISVVGTYYDEDDGRTIRVLGKNHQWQTVIFKKAHFSKAYDVRVQNASALPESKAARTSYLLELNERFPGKVSDEQVLEMLDLAQSDKFVDVATASVSAAEAENDLLLTQEVDAEEHEDHIQHWKVHAADCQQWNFKMHTPPEVQERKKNHLMAHEMMMWDRAQSLPGYAERLAKECPQYPMFFDPRSMLEQQAKREALLKKADQVEAAAEAEAQAQEAAGAAMEAQLPNNPDLGGVEQLPINPDLGGPPAVPSIPANPGAADPNRQV